MSRQLDIYKLADDVLASIAEPVTEKVAEADPNTLKTEIGLALKHAAAALREVDPAALDYEDVAAVLNGAQNYLMGKTASVSTSADADLSSSSGVESELGNELRKLATQLREEASKSDVARATKAAHVITAAVGLKHLENALRVKD